MEKTVEIRRRAVLAAPRDPELRWALARALAHAGRGAEALAELRVASALRPLPLDLDRLRGELFAEFARPLRGAPLAIAIGEALGLRGPYEEPDDPPLDTFHLHAGARCPATGRVAWVEERQRDQGGGLMDCSLALKVTAGDGVETRWELATYNPYFGCSVLHLDWVAERVLVVYREKHRVLAALAGPERATLIDAGHEHLLMDDRLWSSSSEHGLLRAVAVPGFERRVPLPVPLELDHRSTLTRDGEALSFGHVRVRLPLPAQRRISPAPALRVAITAAVFGAQPPQPLADLLVGALTWPFWLERDPVARTHYAQRGIAWRSPAWLPAYWVRHLARVDGEQAAAAREAIETLGRAAAPPHGWEPSWEPEQGAVRLAQGHLARRCEQLARVIRSGALPGPRASCQFWNDGPRAAFREALAGFPPGLQQVFRELDRAPPRPLAGPDA